MTELTGKDWVPSIELEKIRSLLNTDDAMLLVIRGHLILEHVLISFIRAGLSNPEFLKIDRLNFPAKTQLAVAMGLLSKDLAKTLLHVNGLRNEFAHNLEFQVTAPAIDKFFDTFPPEGRELLLRKKGGFAKSIPLEKVRFRRFFEVLFVLLDLTRHHYIEWLQRNIDADENLKKALADLEKFDAESGLHEKGE